MSLIVIYPGPAPHVLRLTLPTLEREQLIIRMAKSLDDLSEEWLAEPETRLPAYLRAGITRDEVKAFDRDAAERQELWRLMRVRRAMKKERAA